LANKRKGKGKGKSKQRSSRKTQAQQADRYVLYEKAVQQPDADIAFVRRVFKKRYGRHPRTLREDFCGTAVFAADWVKKSPENRAWGIDLDPVPLEWGRRHHVSKLTDEQASRLKLIEGNVLDVGHEPVDVTGAFNFSYFIFKTRDELRHYFEKARASLRDEGLLFLDAYGGGDSMNTSQEDRKIEGGFTYVWDQHAFDPITHDVTNFIHFKFPDGSRLRRAFRYDWRLWTLPEIQELLIEAGFSGTEVYWEGADEDGEGNGIFTLKEHAPDDPAWIAYIVGIR
jgi:hypothetical protein